MRTQKKGCYTIKTYQNKLYTWCPEKPTYNKNTGINRAKNSKKYSCTATPGSQGEDWITTYCYNIVNNNGLLQKIAYVECDYVK
jgi:hypothetical protein